MKPWRWALAVVAAVLLLAACAPSFLLWRGKRSLDRASRYDAFADASPDSCVWKQLRSSDDGTAVRREWSRDKVATALQPWFEGTQPMSSLPPPARADLDRYTERNRAALRCETSVTPRVDYTALNGEFIMWGRMTALDVRRLLEAGDAEGAATQCARALRWVAVLSGPYGSLYTTDQMLRALEAPCLAAKAKHPAAAAHYAAAAQLLPTTEVTLGVRWWIFARAEYAEVTSASALEFSRLPDMLRVARKCSKSERLFDTYLSQENEPEARLETDQRFADVVVKPPFEDEEKELPELEPSMKRLESLRAGFARLGTP